MLCVGHQRRVGGAGERLPDLRIGLGLVAALGARVEPVSREQGGFLGSIDRCESLAREARHAAAILPPTTATSQLTNLQHGAPVNVVGTISPNNPILVENYVAYYECIDTTCYPDLPPQLLIQVADGEIVISKNSYEDHSWPKEADVFYLALDQPVVVAGIARRNGDEVTVEGAIVFAGSYDLFVRRAENQQIVPLILMGASLLAAAGGLFISLSFFRLSSGRTQGNS